MAHIPKDRKIADLVRRLHAEAKVRGRAAPLLEEAATNLRLQATEIERLKSDDALVEAAREALTGLSSLEEQRLREAFKQLRGKQ